MVSRVANQEDRTTEPRSRGRAWPWKDIGGLVLLGSALRLPGLLTELWFDEIWSYQEFARRARSVFDIFFDKAFRHDNNHHLNTVILYWLGDQAGWVYRLPALVAGLVTIALAVRLGNRRGPLNGRLFGLLVAVSFTMVLCSTEARGYAYLLLFVSLGFLALDVYLRRPGWAAAAGFWGSIILGVLAHFDLVHFYMGALLWSGFSLRGRTRDLARLHVVPLAFLALWLVVAVRGLIVGGGPPWHWRAVTDDAFAWTLGYPVGIIPAAVPIVVAAAALAWHARWLWSAGTDEGLFYVGTILGPPILVAALSPPFLFARYFLVSIYFLLLVFADGLAYLWQSRHWGKAACITLLCSIIAGNLVHATLLAKYGRGHAAEAIAFMLQSTPKSEILVTSKSVELWSTLPLEFFQDRLGTLPRIRYVSRQELRTTGIPSAGIDWVIVQAQGSRAEPASEVTLASGDIYKLRRTYAAYGPSGTTWFLYGPIK